MRRCAWAAGIALAACGLLASQASAFGTVDSGVLDQRAEHERITRAALACTAQSPPAGACFEPLSIDQLAGRDGEFGAVGAPDVLGPLSERTTPSAHCDDADFIRRDKGYPQSRARATAALQACHDHLQGALLYGLLGAAELVSADGRIQDGEVRLKGAEECGFYPKGNTGRAKCDALEGLGRALHGAQDFYSHSNWTDRRVAEPSIDNPDGLARRYLAPAMDLRRVFDPSDRNTVPDALTTGCYVDRTVIGLPRAGHCTGRITHDAIEKDKGLIDPVTGQTGDPLTDRGKVGTRTVFGLGGNFQDAVTTAILETRRQWSDFRTALQALYPRDASRMICALTRDDPLHTCHGRRIAITIDSSGSNTDTDPGNLRVDAAIALNDGLLSKAEAGPGATSDLSAVVTFTNSARVCSPLGDPPKADFSCVRSDGGTSIASGIRAATAELTRNASESEIRDRSGIVVFTDGLDDSTFAIEAAIRDAAGQGIRVSIGLLDPVEVSPPPPPPPPPPPKLRGELEAAQASDPPPSYVRAILDSGGIYATISSAEDQREFVRLVNTHGATNLDDPNGPDDGGTLVADIASSGAIADRADTDTFTFNATAGRIVDFGVRPLVQGALAVTLTDVRTGKVVMRSSRLVAGAVAVRARPRVHGPFEVTVARAKGTTVPATTGAPYTIGARQFGVDLFGTDNSDVLECTETATYVRGGLGSDAVRCGAGHDTIVGGPDADDLAGGRGNDVFLVEKEDVHKKQTEAIDGGRGKDRVELPFKRPKGVRCIEGRAKFTRKGARWTIRSVERIVFKGRTC